MDDGNTITLLYSMYYLSAVLSKMSCTLCECELSLYLVLCVYHYTVHVYLWHVLTLFLFIYSLCAAEYGAQHAVTEPK